MISVFTTINIHGNFEPQNEAMVSWSKYYKVYSVNPVDEIEIGKEKFPFINFIESDNIFNYNNKKLIKLNGILDSIKLTNCEYCCIVNSDIILKKKIEKKHLKSDLLISTRWELDDINHTTQKTYPFDAGYDIFLFEKSLIDIFYNKNYVIGMPWWDYWIPLIAIKLGLKVDHVKNPIIFHRTHPTNYDYDSWVKFGGYLYDDIILKLMKRKIEIDVSKFCAIVKNFIEKKQNNIKIK
jgi:hypothetical protein